MVALALSHPFATSRGQGNRPQGFGQLAGTAARAFSSDCRSKPAKTGAVSSTSMRGVSEFPMEQSRKSVPTVVGERHTVADRIIAYIRARYPLKAAECVAADLNISGNTVQRWIDRSSAPSAATIFRMIHAYGPEFLAAVMGDAAPVWLRKEAHEARRVQIAAQMAVLQRELETL